MDLDEAFTVSGHRGSLLYSGDPLSPIRREEGRENMGFSAHACVVPNGADVSSCDGLFIVASLNG